MKSNFSFVSRRNARTMRVKASESSPPARTLIPQTPELQVKQCIESIVKLREDGKKRATIELLLPLIGATDLDDWPGGVRQQFKAALPLVESILRDLKQREGLQGKLNASILDDGDAVGLWEGENFSTVVFPTAETLDQITEASKRSGKELFLMVNPQWVNKGQLIPDFGLFGRRAKEEFVASFSEVAYSFRQLRLEGETIRVLRAYPGDWHVYAIDGDTFLLGTFKKCPTYQEIVDAAKARPGSKASMDFVERLRAEIAFNEQSLKQQPQNRKQ